MITLRRMVKAAGPIALLLASSFVDVAQSAGVRGSHHHKGGSKAGGATPAGQGSHNNKALGPPQHFLHVKADYNMPRVSFDYHSVLNATWAGLKARNIDAYQVKLLHRPRSETPHDAVSEGVGYGLILALYTNDQPYFNTLLDNAEKYMWNGNFHDWRVDEWGTKTATGAATDAEQDIAVMLIFAQHLVDAGAWQPHTTPQGATYGQRAQRMLDAMWDLGMIQDAKYVAPGAGWGGRNFVNPGYFSPAWYRVFKAFDSNRDRHNWDSVIDQCYASVLASVGVGKGLIPDWMTPWGSFVTESLGYNPYKDGQAFFKDAIRTHWRLATDYAWNKEPRAKEFLDQALSFITAKGGPSAANFFTMDGEFLPKTDTWLFNGEQTTRHRYEHSHLTTGMWATTAIAAGGVDSAEGFSQELLKFYEGGDFWGNTVDPTGFNEDIAHNELYFDQFLAWFGASLISGYFVDVTKAI